MSSTYILFMKAFESSRVGPRLHSTNSSYTVLSICQQREITHNTVLLIMITVIMRAIRPFSRPLFKSTPKINPSFLIKKHNVSYNSAELCIKLKLRVIFPYPWHVKGTYNMQVKIVQKYMQAQSHKLTSYRKILKPGC